MSEHLSAKQLNGYIHQTLTDAARETIEAHLVGCQLCRGQLAEYTGLQQRVRYELLGNLNSLHAPSTLTFSNTIARRQHALGLAWPQAVRVFAGLIVLAIVIVMIGGVINLVDQSSASPTPISSTTRVASTAGYVGGWLAWTGDDQGYEVGLDFTVVHGGQASGYISSTLGNSKDVGNLTQPMRPDRYLGKRLRLSGYLKTDQVTGRAGLWMRVDGPQSAISSMDNMVNRPIRGTTDWQKYDIVLDIPADSTNIQFGILLIGNGRVWIDDVQFEIVGTDVATTAVTEEMLATEMTPTPTPESTPSPLDLAALAQPTNLSFEAGATGWSLTGDTQHYASGVDSTVMIDGQNSGFLAWDASKPIGAVRLVQSVKADQYRGQRLRLSAQAKSDSISQWQARYFASAYAANGEELLSDSRPLHGTTWQKGEIVFDVPDTATRIDYGIVLEGQGRAWLDDVQVEVVGKDVSTTTYAGRPNPAALRPTGVDLDATMSNWNVGGSRPQDYTIGFDSTIARSGQSSAHIKSITPVPASEFGTLNTDVMADNYLGKRVRFSAYVRANNVKTWAGLWMSVVGPSGKLLGYDNMQNRAIRGTNDWQKYEVVLDVPDSSGHISYGVLLVGQGEVWFDDVQFEAVGDDVPVTDLFHQEPLNLDFEKAK